MKNEENKHRFCEECGKKIREHSQFDNRGVLLFTIWSSDMTAVDICPGNERGFHNPMPEGVMWIGDEKGAFLPPESVQKSA